jgi:hypothetical protein
MDQVIKHLLCFHSSNIKSPENRSLHRVKSSEGLNFHASKVANKRILERIYLEKRLQEKNMPFRQPQSLFLRL